MLKETRKIMNDKVRSLCIRNNFYTCGDCEEYDNLLSNLCSGNKEITTSDLIEIADDILKHSSNLFYSNDDIKSLVFDLANSCCYTVFDFEEV